LPPADPQVRVATSADLGAIRAVGIEAGELFRSVDDPRIAERADDPPFELDELAAVVRTGAAWVAEVGGEVSGFLLAEELDGAAHVEEVSVRPQAQGRGLATALLEAAADWAGERGMAAMTLTTFRDVAWNRPFYERRGFRVLGDDELSDALVARRAAEAAVGLDPAIRVVMRRDL
jgi:GNAT superfamily N-acetyltransferase